VTGVPKRLHVERLATQKEVFNNFVASLLASVCFCTYTGCSTKKIAFTQYCKNENNFMDPNEICVSCVNSIDGIIGFVDPLRTKNIDFEY
jgi:hypothetical protein